MDTGIRDKYIYIVASQTGTVLSRILKFMTRKEYNHVSVSFDDDLALMYSFGRKRPNNPFLAGFVTESADFGTFKKFFNTKILVGKLAVDDTEYQKLRAHVNKMIKNPESYHYNYWGLYLAALKISIEAQNRFYCSEFVKYLLYRSGIEGADKIKRIAHPMCFLDLPRIEIIYKGKLTEYKDYMLINKNNLLPK